MLSTTLVILLTNQEALKLNMTAILSGQIDPNVQKLYFNQI